MTPTEFAIVRAALRVGLDNLVDADRNRIFRHQVERLERHLIEIGDRAQAANLRLMLDPPPDPYPPGAKVVLS